MGTQYVIMERVAYRCPKFVDEMHFQNIHICRYSRFFYTVYFTLKLEHSKLLLPLSVLPIYIIMIVRIHYSINREN